MTIIKKILTCCVIFVGILAMLFCIALHLTKSPVIKYPLYTLGVLFFFMISYKYILWFEALRGKRKDGEPHWTNKIFLTVCRGLVIIAIIELYVAILSVGGFIIKAGKAIGLSIKKIIENISEGIKYIVTGAGLLGSSNIFDIARNIYDYHQILDKVEKDWQNCYMAHLY